MSLSWVAVPVLQDTNNTGANLANQWARVYHYGHQAIPPCAISTMLLYGYSAVTKYVSGKPWIVFLVAAGTTMSMIPFTEALMVPTNDALFALQKQGKDGKGVTLGETQGLLRKWNWLHFSRSFLPLAGAVIGLLAYSGTLVF